VENIADARTGHPDDTLGFAVQGWSERISQFTWQVEANCTLYEPWRIIQLAEDTGEAVDFLACLGTDGSSRSHGEQLDDHDRCDGHAFEVEAGRWYALDCYLRWTSNPTADIKFVWSKPASNTSWMLLGPVAGTAPVAGG
jgi:hypothetical protein